MKVVIGGKPKEIADFVKVLQNQPDEECISIFFTKDPEEKALHIFREIESLQRTAKQKK